MIRYFIRCRRSTATLPWDAPEIGSVRRVGPVAYESVVDSALLRPELGPSETPLLYLSCTQKPSSIQISNHSVSMMIDTVARKIGAMQTLFQVFHKAL